MAKMSDENAGQKRQCKPTFEGQDFWLSINLFLDEFALLPSLHFLIYWNLALSFPTSIKATFLLLLSAHTFLHLIIFLCLDRAIKSMV